MLLKNRFKNIIACKYEIQLRLTLSYYTFMVYLKRFVVDGSMITPSGPITVVIVVVNRDCISELTIHSVYVPLFV